MQNNIGAKVVPVFQQDGAGLNNCKSFQTFLNDLESTHDWIIFRQPPNSPVTNTNDACTFPMASKKVSRSQSVVFGGTLLKNKQLNRTVMNVLFDPDILPAIARAYIGHSQIPGAIIEYKGDNNYLSERKGMHFGVRKTFISNEKGDGVTVIPLQIREGESIQCKVVADRVSWGLK